MLVLLVSSQPVVLTRRLRKQRSRHWHEEPQKVQGSAPFSEASDATPNRKQAFSSRSQGPDSATEEIDAATDTVRRSEGVRRDAWERIICCRSAPGSATRIRSDLVSIGEDGRAATGDRHHELGVTHRIV